jgi:hypothetical protein
MAGSSGGGASWWRKLDRARHHLREVERLVGEFSARCDPKGRLEAAGRDRYALVAAFDATVDPALALALGDVVHNIRSALDHAFVALLPPSKGRYTRTFPILADPPKQREWARALADLPAEVVHQIDILQPHHGPPAEIDASARDMTPEEQQEANALGALAVLDNADKHRSLIPVELGVTGVSFLLSVDGRVPQFELRPPDFVTDGLVIGHGVVPHGVGPDEVLVGVRGEPTAVVKLGELSGGFVLPSSMNGLIDHVGLILEWLERYVPDATPTEPSS